MVQSFNFLYFSFIPRNSDDPKQSQHPQIVPFELVVDIRYAEIHDTSL